MRALITGGAGFIGSHLADRLLARGDQVVLLDDLSTGRLANIAHLEGDPDAEFVLGSILNADLVDHVVSRVDAVYHLAAAVGVNLIVEKPLESLMTNIRGTETVVEKAHKYGKRILVASTSEIYGKNTSDRLSEDDDRILGSPLKSRWSYSEAKAIDEILAYTYWREKGLETVIVRLFNTVGPRQTGSYGMDGRPAASVRSTTWSVGSSPSPSIPKPWAGSSTSAGRRRSRWPTWPSGSSDWPIRPAPSSTSRTTWPTRRASRTWSVGFPTPPGRMTSWGSRPRRASMTSSGR